MKVLILGGTKFVGRSIVDELLKDDDLELTLCNRGKTADTLFPELPRILADREKDELADKLKGDWDAIVDVSSYYPDSLATFLDGMAGRVGRYVFISTGSVYRIQEDQSPFHEDLQTNACSADQRKDTGMESYGARKAACEREILSRNLNAVILRPGLIFGPYDPFDRHYYWLYRVKQGKDFLVPEGTGPEAHTFSRDLARLVHESIRIPDHRQVYNTPTHAPVSIHELVLAMAGALGTELKANVVEQQALLAAGIKPVSDMPMWWGGLHFLKSGDRIQQDFRTALSPLSEALKETAAWYASLGWQPPSAGMDYTRETEMMATKLAPQAD